MPIVPPRPRRPGRALLWSALALLAAFFGLAAYEKFFVANHFAGNQDLLNELAEVEFLDEKPSTAPWAQWRGPDRDGVTSMPDLLRDWPDKGPPRLWSQPGGEGYSSFSIAGGRAFTMLGRGDAAEAVVCLDLADGRTVWDRTFDLARSFQYGGPRATPTLAGGRLFTTTSDGTLLCLDPADGKTVWQTDLRAEASAVPPQWGFAFSPLVAERLVYANPGGPGGHSLAALDRGTGKVAWAAQDDPAGYSSPVAVTIDGVEQVLFFTGRRLLGVTPGAGKLLWEFPFATQFGVNAATPLVVRGRRGPKENTYVFISAGYRQGCALVKIAPRGEGRFEAQAVYTSNELCCHFASPVRFKDHLYGLDETRDLTCLDLRTGAVAWRFDRPDDASPLRRQGFQKGSILRVDDVLLLLGERGKLALVAADPKEYRELAAAQVFRPTDTCWTTPVLADGKLLLRDRKRILCLDVKKAVGKK